MKLWRYGRAIEQLAQRYRLEGSLGSGGMADVCLAWDERDEREVAIKVIRPDTLDQRTLDRFMKEAAQVAKWHHPHILRVYSDLKLELLDAAQGAIVPYIVMEYAQGGDLQKRLTAGQPYPLATTLDIFAQLCSAVAYAHKQGVIHRDLKPLNILFRSLPGTPDEVVLSDFGLAVEMSATHHTFARGGTLPYMAPEQLQGHVEAASDIFALGVILYQLCTGRLPFRRSLQDLRRVDAFSPPILPSRIAPNLPPSLDDAILIALAELPAARYADASQFWEAVQTAIASLQDSTRLRVGADGEHGLIPLRSSAPLQGYVQGGKSSKYEGTNSRGALERSAISPSISRRAHRVPGSQVSQYADSSPDISSHSSIPSRTSRIPNTRISANSRPSVSRPNPVRLRLIAPIALLLLLVTGGILYFTPPIHNKFFPSSSTITVTLNPASQPVQAPYSIPTSSANAHQVTFAQSQAQTVQGTGHKQTAGTQARGELTFLNGAFVTQTVPAGTMIVGKDGIQVLIDNETNIPPTDPNTNANGNVNVSAHAVNSGTRGNILALDINRTCCVPGSAIFVKNTTAFTGGQDAQNYQFIQQADVQNVTDPIIATLTKQAQSALQTRLSADERIAGTAQCTPNVSIDQQHPVGDTGVNVPATSATVTVQCSAEAYNGVHLKGVIGQQLGAHTQRPGPDYTLILRLIAPPMLQTVNGQQVFAGNASGTWIYQVSDAQRRQLAQSVVGLSVAAAIQKVRAETGIQNVTVTGANGPLPGDAAGIRVVVVAR